MDFTVLSLIMLFKFCSLKTKGSLLLTLLFSIFGYINLFLSGFSLFSIIVPSSKGILFLKYNWHSCLELIIFLAFSVHLIPKSYKDLMNKYSSQSVNLLLPNFLYNSSINLKSFFSFFIFFISLILFSISFLNFINSSIAFDVRGRCLLSSALAIKSEIVFSFLDKNCLVLFTHSLVIFTLLYKFWTSSIFIVSVTISFCLIFWRDSTSVNNDSALGKYNFNFTA